MRIYWMSGNAGVIVASTLLGVGSPMAQSLPDGLPECPVTGRALSKPLNCLCIPGFAQNHRWGSGPYSGGTDICFAARHAGVIDREGGAIRVVPGPPQEAYSGSVANGLTSNDSDWTAFPSFLVEPVVVD